MQFDWEQIKILGSGGNGWAQHTMEKTSGDGTKQRCLFGIVGVLIYGDAHGPSHAKYENPTTRQDELFVEVTDALAAAVLDIDWAKERAALGFRYSKPEGVVMFNNHAGTTWGDIVKIVDKVKELQTV